MIELYNEDCMVTMARYPDKYFDLAIVDPPYGIDINDQSQGKGGGVARKIYYAKKWWDKVAPTPEYFDLLNVKSKNFVVFGANHFIDNVPFNVSSPCWLVWDKDNGETDFADCELALTTFKTSVRKFRYTWAGMRQQNMKNKETRIHPTQKPVALYKWILNNYAKQGDKILDTHGGSMSIAIACHDYKFDLVLSELDKDYFAAGKKRFDNHVAQMKLF